jgi:hypothetical protein
MTFGTSNEVRHLLRERTQGIKRRSCERCPALLLLESRLTLLKELSYDVR